MKDQHRWCVFQVLPGANGKARKIPLIAGMRPLPGVPVHAKCDDPVTWRSFPEALADAEARGLHLGFAFDRDLALTFIDLDDAIGPDGTLTPDAQRVVEVLNGYTETSIGGTGLHVVVRGLPPEHFTLNGFEGHIEVYPRRGGRFMVATGDRRPGLGSSNNCIEERSVELARLFPAPPDNDCRRSRLRTRHGALTRLSEPEEDAIVAWAMRFWTEGRRHHMALYLAGYLGKHGVPRDQAIGIIERLVIADEDAEARTQAVDDTYDGLEVGEEVAGYIGLRDVCGLSADDLASLEAAMRDHWRTTSPKVHRLYLPGGLRARPARLRMRAVRHA
jgi:hypothetical protein